MDFGPTLDRLARPLNDALDYIGIRTSYRRYTLLFLLREITERRRTFVGWTTGEWLETIHHLPAAPSTSTFINAASSQLDLRVLHWNGVRIFGDQVEPAADNVCAKN